MQNAPDKNKPRPDEPAHPKSPPERRDMPQKPEDRPLGTDPESEGESNESLPEGSQPREKNPTMARLKEMLQRERPERGSSNAPQRREPAPSDLFNGA